MPSQCLLKVPEPVHREWKHAGQTIQCIRDSSLFLEAGEKSLIAIYTEIHS